MLEQQRSARPFNIIDYEFLPDLVAGLLPSDQKTLMERVINHPRCRVLNASTLGRLREEELLACGWDEGTQRRMRALNLQARASVLEGRVSKEKGLPSYQWVSSFNLGRVVSSLVDGQREVERLRYQADQIRGDLPAISPEDYNQLITEVVRQVTE